MGEELLDRATELSMDQQFLYCLRPCFGLSIALQDVWTALVVNEVVHFCKLLKFL